MTENDCQNKMRNEEMSIKIFIIKPCKNENIWILLSMYLKDFNKVILDIMKQFSFEIKI